MGDSDQDQETAETGEAIMPVPVTAPPVVQPAPPSYPYIHDPAAPGRRLFNDTAVQKVLDEKIAALPEGTRGAVIAHGDSDGNAALSIVGKSGDHWTFVAGATHTPKGKFTGEAEVRYSW